MKKEITLSGTNTQKFLTFVKIFCLYFVQPTMCIYLQEMKL